jgi:hypothetical protein
VLLRYPHEVPDSTEYFDGIQDANIAKYMIATKPAKNAKTGSAPTSRCRKNDDCATYGEWLC